jgi:N,N'-diacetyllegionaminate synthase
MKIGSKDTSQKVFIIAEIGNNHEGSLDAAKKLVCAASEAGADAVKLQTIVPELLVSASQPERLNQLRNYALRPEHYLVLKKQAELAGVMFLSTPFDLDSVDFLNELVPAFKIASGDSNFGALLKKVAATGKPVMVSTGLSDDMEKKSIRDTLFSAWKTSRLDYPGLALLHCVSEYPTPDDRAGLRYLEVLREWRDVTVGYSDHTLGIEAAVLAVGLGARIVEKHFTLDKSRTSFRDHALSADPQDFQEMVRRIRRAEAFLKPVRHQDPPSTAPALRRSAAAARDLSAGHILTERDLIWLRPGIGFCPGSETALFGRKLFRPVGEGQLISTEDIIF